ncbi:hypothetical protein EJ110_NYTH38550 [Nymphaea thermarum]|nr:hypothetical protein EJ110_NYTH38550 [Nymphaea thermarum]
MARDASLFVLFHKAAKNIGHCEDGQTFQCMWTQMIQVYNLQKNMWLLYKDDKKWALAYRRQYFCVGLISTHRVESMHNAMTRELHSGLKISLFMKHYDKFLDGLGNCELEQT